MRDIDNILQWVHTPQLSVNIEEVLQSFDETLSLLDHACADVQSEVLPLGRLSRSVKEYRQIIVDEVDKLREVSALLASAESVEVLERSMRVQHMLSNE